MLSSGEVIAYVTPDDGEDTFLAHVNWTSRAVTKSIVGGNQGELRCLPGRAASKCYGVSPGEVDSGTPTQLIEVDATTGDSKPALSLGRYDGYLVDASAIDAASSRYHAVLVGSPHGKAPGKSNQWLVTIDLASMAIIAEVPVSRYFCGPLSVSIAHGLATFGGDAPGLVAVDYRSGKQSPLVACDFGTITMYSGAFSRTRAYVVNVYPHPPRFFAVELSAAGPAAVITNATFRSDVHALSAA